MKNVIIATLLSFIPLLSGYCEEKMPDFKALETVAFLGAVAETHPNRITEVINDKKILNLGSLDELLTGSQKIYVELTKDTGAMALVVLKGSPLDKSRIEAALKARVSNPNLVPQAKKELAEFKKYLERVEEENKKAMEKTYLRK